MNAINFRTIPNNPKVFGVAIPVRVEASLAEPVDHVQTMDDLQKVPAKNAELRQGQQWANAINQILTNVEPHLAQAVELDERRGDLNSGHPGSVAVNGPHYDILADYKAGDELGSKTITHASIASKTGQKVLEFSVNPNGTVTMTSEVGYPHLSFTARHGRIKSEAVDQQVHKLESNRRADESYSNALHREMMKPGWEDSIAHDHWLHCC